MSTRLVIVGLFIYVATSGSAVAQQSGRSLHYPPDGKVIMRVSPGAEPETLDELIRMSQTIVDGTVTSALPAVATSKDVDVPGVETHSIVTVGAILKGNIPNNAGTILLAQIGGKAGRWDVSAAGDTLVMPGERYIFFLISDDDRKDLPNTSKTPRYSVVGVWIGKAKVVGGRIRFLSQAGSELHQLDNTDVGAFIKTVKDKVNYMPKTKLPIHPGGPMLP